METINEAVASADTLGPLALALALELERDAVLAQLDDRTNQTWACKRARWAALVRAQDAEIQRLRAALTLAANRMDVLALDHDYGTTRRNIVDDWATETRAALGPNATGEAQPQE